MRDTTRPPLQEIPSRPARESGTRDSDVAVLVHSIKHGLDQKLDALRRDMEMKLHDRISGEVASLKATVDQELGEEKRRAGELITTGIARASGAIESRVENHDSAIDGLAGRVEVLEQRVEDTSALAGDVHVFKEEIASKVARIEERVQSFDLTIFVDEIRQAFSERAARAEARAAALVESLREATGEIEVLQAAARDASARHAAEIEALERDLASKDAALARAAMPASHEDPAGSPAPGPASAKTGHHRVPRFCVNCGHARGEDARFCMLCGLTFT